MTRRTRFILIMATGLGALAGAFGFFVNWRDHRSAWAFFDAFLVGLNLTMGVLNWRYAVLWPWKRSGTGSTTSRLPAPSSIQTGNLSPSDEPSQPSSPSENRSSSRPDRPFVGFRAWKRVGSQLYPLHMGTETPWNGRQPTRARCASSKSHDAPEPHCHCGLWAKWNLRDARGYAGGEFVVGAVLGWGRTQRHGAEGWRSEYAQVIGLLGETPAPVPTTSLSFDVEGARKQMRSLAAVAEQMDVPLLGASELERFALSQGMTFADLEEGK